MKCDGMCRLFVVAMLPDNIINMHKFTFPDRLETTNSLIEQFKVYIYIYMYVCVCECVRACVRACVCVCVCVSLSDPVSLYFRFTCKYQVC